MSGAVASWDEIRTAYEVARRGTVSAAAAALGVHHATVIRHVDALEARLGVKLFQRHARGYTPTETGQDLLAVAAEAEARFAQLLGRIRGQGAGVAGELVVTSLPTYAALLTPALVDLQTLHPGLILRYLTGGRLFRLERGEAHVAVRAGVAPPDQPDNVVRPLMRERFALAAAPAYLERWGRPEADDLARHRFVGHDEEGSRAPFNGWLLPLAPRERVTWRVADDASMTEAVAAGAGLGFVPLREVAARGLVEALPWREDWAVPLWLVTHVDLHRSPKVQACLALLRERAKGWE